jgi:hypothetical protein
MIRFSIIPLCLSTVAACSEVILSTETSAESELASRTYPARLDVSSSAPSELRWRAGFPQPALSATALSTLRQSATRDAHAICDVILGSGAWTTVNETEALTTEWDHFQKSGLRYTLEVKATCVAALPSREAFLDKLFLAAGGPGIETPASAISTARIALEAQPAPAWVYLMRSKLAPIPQAIVRDFGAYTSLRIALTTGEFTGEKNSALLRTEAARFARSSNDREAFLGVFALLDTGTSFFGMGESARALIASNSLLDALPSTRDVPADPGFGEDATLRTLTLEALRNVYPCDNADASCFGRADLQSLQARTVLMVAPSLASPARALAAATLARAGEAAVAFAERALHGNSQTPPADGATVLDGLQFPEMRQHVAVSTLARALAVGSATEQRSFLEVLRAIAGDANRPDATTAGSIVEAFCKNSAPACSH